MEMTVTLIAVVLTVLWVTLRQGMKKKEQDRREMRGEAEKWWGAK